MPENPNRAEVARRVEKAEKLLQKGKTADALTEYLQILDSDPQNDNVRQMAADLCLSLNKGPQAVRLLGELFERQVAAAEATRASLTYKKLARYANPTWEQKVRFGQLLEHSNKKLAIGTYENALEDLQKQGRKEEVLLVLGRVVSLEPSQTNHLRVGELSAELGEHVMASQSFLQLAELAEAAGGNGSSWFERAYSENPTDSKIAVAYGKSLLSRGEAGAAIFIFEPLVHAGDASLDLRDVYAQALLKLFDLYCANHDYQKAGECLDRAADVDPYERGHQKRLESLRGKIDDQRFKVIASRFTTVKKEQQTVKVEE